MSQESEKALTDSLNKGEFNPRIAQTYLHACLVEGVRPNAVVLLKSLLHALTHFHDGNVFSQLLSLCPLRTQESSALRDGLTALKNLEMSLLGARFDEFWAAWRAIDSQLLPSVPTFEDDIRLAILKAVADAVVSIPEAKLRDYLGGVEPQTLMSKNHIAGSCASGMVSFEENTFNSPKPTKEAEKLTLENLTKIIALNA